MVKLEMENRALEEATKHAQAVETTKKLVNQNPNNQKDFQASLRTQSGVGATGDLSSTRTFVSKLTSANVLGEGKPSLKTQQILKLRMQNEDKAARTQQTREIQAELESEKKQKYEQTLMSTNRKLLSFQEQKESDLQMKQERIDKRLQDVAKNQKLLDLDREVKNQRLQEKLQKQSTFAEASQRKKLDDLEAKFDYV